MTGVHKLEIAENEEDLKQLLRVQKTASDQERIQLLYLLETDQSKTEVSRPVSVDNIDERVETYKKPR